MKNVLHRAEEIVDAALDLRPDERPAYVQKSCGHDAQLQDLVEGLLLAHRKAPPIRTQATLTAGKSTVAAVAEKPGDMIGRYRLVQQIGEGGGGIVYMAEQEEPVRRSVALKIIKLGMDTRQVIARFEAERQALAMMEHPNIAKVFDAGATGTGRPYFVMELVRGVKITDYCDQNNLSTTERLELFVQVCNAIQHAHQKGSIHRDIKPSNILVTLHDAKPIPKVIDFGIAKAIEAPLSNETVLTSLEQFLGTPAYMSPEQAKISPDASGDIDTRSDIYSLGVLLYELLSGKLPFDPKDLVSAGLDEIRRIIREKDPVRPSTRIGTLNADEQTTVARRRQLQPPKLINLVQGDLDWIVMKCLEKDRTRRYQTTNGLVQDIERHLNSEPVMACPPNNLYRLQKLIRRNKLAFAAGGTVIVALLLGTGTSTWLFMRERAARRQAIAEASKNAQFAALLADTLGGVDPSVARGMDTKLLTLILTNASVRIGKQLTNQPAVEADMRLVIGKTFYGLGQLSNALWQTRAALHIRQQYFGPTNEAVADAMANSAAILFDLGDLRGAEKTGREALAMRKAVLGQNHPKVATSLNNLGNALWRQGKLAEAEDLGRQALQIRKKVLPPNHPDIAQSFNNLGNFLLSRGDYAAAEVLYRDALALQKTISSETHPQVAMYQNNLALVVARNGNLEGSRALHEKTLALRRRIFPKDHNHIALSLTQLAVVTSAMDDLDKAEEMLHEAQAMQNRLAMGNHYEVADTLLDLGIVQLKKGDFAAAEVNLQRALSMRKILYGSTNSDVAEVLDWLGIVKAGGGDLEDAEKSLREALEIDRKELSADHPDLVPVLLHLSWVSNQKRADSGQALLNEALGIGEKRGLCGARAVTDAFCDLADVLQAKGRTKEAELLLLKADQACQGPAVSKSPVQRHVLQHCARFYEAWAKAEPDSARAAKASEWKQKVAKLNASQ